jgi:hypothetical protein
LISAGFGLWNNWVPASWERIGQPGFGKLERMEQPGIGKLGRMEQLDIGRLRIMEQLGIGKLGRMEQLGFGRLEKFRKERRRNILKLAAVIICVLLALSGIYAVASSIHQ